MPCAHPSCDDPGEHEVTATVKGRHTVFYLCSGHAQTLADSLQDEPDIVLTKEGDDAASE